MYADGKLSVVADEGIVGVRERLAPFADVVTLDGRAITPAHVRDADVLLIRSITRVDAALLDASRVRLVGSATSGTDHVDIDYLQRRGIALVDARGSNASAVAEYCIAAIGHLVDSMADVTTIGVVGAGCTGARLVELARAVDFDVSFCDPLLDEDEVRRLEALGARPVALAELLGGSDIVSLHVPLTVDGAYPTAGLLSVDALDAMRRGSLLINTSRGEVISTGALRRLAGGSGTVRCAFDVWRHEPDVDRELVAAVDIATPHIAGYSASAKRAAAEQVIAGVAMFAGFDPVATGDALPELPAPVLDASDWRAAVAGALPLTELTADFRWRLHHGEPVRAFDEMRRAQASRREFRYHTVRTEPGAAAALSRLGFRVATADRSHLEAAIV